MKPNQRVVWALIASSLVSVLFFVTRSIHNHNTYYWFLTWNLFLAWLPLIFAWRLDNWLKAKPWKSWQAIILTVLWLGFLPNSFYLSSDLIHLQGAQAGNILYDMVMLLSFGINGCLLGFTSIFLIHRQIIKRIKAPQAHAVIAGILLLGSFAIYLGRYMRWNTWDVLVNPAGVLFDVSDRFINPSSHPQTFVTTLSFFMLLGSLYFALWQIAAALQQNKRS